MRWFGRMASASGVFLDVRGGVSYAGMQPSKGRRKGYKASRKGCKRVLHPKGTYTHIVSSSVRFPFVSPGVLTVEGKTHME